MTMQAIMAQLALPETALGWFELIGFLVLYIGAFLALRHKQAATEKDVNGLGERVKDLELGAERRNTRLNVAETLLTNQDKDIRDAQADIARIENMIENFRTEQHEMKEEIIGFMSQRTHEITTSVHDLDKRVAVMQSAMDRLTRDHERREGR